MSSRGGEKSSELNAKISDVVGLISKLARQDLTLYDWEYAIMQ